MNSQPFFNCPECVEVFEDERGLKNHFCIKDVSDTDTIFEDSISAVETSSSIGEKLKQKWSSKDSLALIHKFGEMKDAFEDPKKTKKVFWSQLAQSLHLSFTGNQCKGRWKTMLSVWKTIEDHNRVNGNSAKKYEYGDEISAAVGGKRNILPSHLLESSNPKASSSKTLFSKELLNSRQEEDSCSENEPPKKKSRQIIPKKAELLDWMTSNQKMDSDQRKLEESATERRHQENIGFMKEFRSVLKELVPKIHKSY